MKSWIVSIGALALAVTACNPIVLEPLQGTQSTSATGGGPQEKVVLAMRGGDVPWNAPISAPLMLDQPWSDPESLVLFFSTDSQECSAPLLAPRCLAGDEFWQAIIAIPPELAHPGLISMADPRIQVAASRSFPDGNPECASGTFEGPSLAGVLELITDGSSTLSVKLSEGVQPFGDAIINGVSKGPVVLDGEYTGQICGTLPTASPPTPALTMRGVDLPAPPGGGATPDPDSLVVFLGSLPDTCQDPWAAVDCTNATRLTFTLPAALQTPGLLSLSNPALAATYTRAANNASSVCDQLDGAPVDGTIEILGGDASGLTFKVYQSFALGLAPTGQLYFDGLYSTSICP